MAVYNIYHKDGSRLKDSNGKGITVHSIEYNGTWMGECFVTVTFENEAPISFSIGDYIEYRGERFEINYDPGKIKCASKDSYGGAFKYDSVKFNALSDELVRCDMLDLVLYDNQLHYTALPQFSFYVESLDDLLDRIQANLDELYGKASWKLYSRNKERSIQRGGLESEWNSIYGEGTSDNVIDSTSISISDQTCWDALSLVNSQFDINFIIRNRNVYVGTAGMPTTNIFKYGKGEGLYEIEQNSESDQMIVTRLRAYGSNRNLPNHYYADLGGIPFLNITGDYHEGSTDNGLSVMMEDSTYAGMFTDIISDNGSNMKHCRIRGSIGGYEFEGTLELVKKDATKSTTRLIAEGKEVCDAIKAKIDSGIVEVDFLSGANKAKFDGNRINYVSNLPNNMACDRLMLPGFPNKTLKDWWDAQTEEKKVWLNPSGKEHIFSNEIYRPYVDSLNIEKIGVRPSSIFFDQDDKVNGIVEIYPTIEEMEVDGVRIDEIYSGTNIEDDGRFGDGETVANVDIYLSPKINFDIRGLMQDDFTIHMKDGMCAGREFKIAGCTKQNDGSWRLTIERQPDDSLNLYFPYNDFQIKKGDHFVLSGIELPDAYVEAASEKLLKYCIAYLDKNDYTRYVYQPKVDEIFMARQHDMAMADASGLTKSLYLTLKEGDIMLFKDDDLGIDAEITIDQLTIKEEDGKIPTYEITLREEKEVGTIQKIQNQISSITSGNGGSLSGAIGGGLSSSQIKNLIDAIGSDRFLSKLNPDTAAGIITFLQGTNWGSFTSETGAAMTVDPTTGQTYMEVDRLKVRLKAFFEQLEVQKVGYVGGKIVVSKGQGVDILDVEEIYDSEGNLSAYRCYFLGEQEGRRIDNLLRVDDQMICKDDNISEGSTDGATNKYYWRLATAVSLDVVKRGNNVCHWVDLSATDCDTNSDVPEIGDTICQLGNRTDVDRRGAEVLSVVDANSPSFTIYAGIDSYSLVNKEYIDMGVINGKAYCNIYGSTYIGDRERSTGYLRWNDDTKTFEIKGTIDISSPLSSGDKNLGEALEDAANAYKDEYDAFTSNIDKVIGDFQKQIDGAIETWFYDPEPTLTNEPAVNWTDNTTKDKHLGDLYYSGEGKAYRFQKNGDNYVWQIITDTDITKALEEAKKANDAANKAQGTADSKMKVFVVQPTNNDEYSVGDMWVNATYPADGSTYNNEILHCVTKKAAGEAFSISHWAQSSNIKTQFNNFVNNTYAEDKKDFYNQLDGKVETWYQNDDPKNKWAAADYSKHTGDIWYNGSTNKAYRWTGTAWVELKDQAAIDAKALAESKRRVFTTTTLPTPPYDAKDLWVQGENGDIMVCVTPKAAGATASASDWAKASKYTDDTKANEALTKVGNLQTDVTELGESFETLTNVTLPALSDGIITTSEKENIRQALMQVQKECVDVINAYANLTVNYKSIYDKIAADVRTDFATAYTNLMGSATLSSDGTITYTSGQGGAYGALVDNINTLLNKEGNLTNNEIATINNNIANFNIKYNDFQNRLVVVRNDIEKTLDTRITDVDEQLGGYAYLKKIVGGKTTIDGGLVLTTMLGTGYEVTGGAYKIMSGISGLYETAKSVAIWAGGSMIDKFVYYDAESGKFNVPDDVNPANFLVRMDGTGYAAGGNFWWDNDGKIHADPQSFLINEQYVGNVMQLFELHYREAGKTDFTNVDYVTPTRMFNGLELSDKGLQIGDTAKLYVKNGVLFIEGDLAVTGGITMYASDGVKSGMIDQVYAVLDQSIFSIKDGVITITGEIGGGTVKAVKIGSTQYDPDTNGIIALTLNWGDLTGVPTTFTPSAHTHDDRYYIKSDIDTKLGLKLDTSLKGTANGLATLDASGKVPSAQLPSYVDDVLECTNKASFPTTGESGKIYIDQTTNLTYRWGGTAYVEISQSLALGETSSTAYAGDKGKQNAADIATLKTGKADKATTLAGYGITDAYTKTEVNTKLTDGSVTKVGKVDVGSATKPIYLKAGVPTAVTLVDTANNLINNLTTGTANPVDADYYIAQYAGGGTTTTTYHRRPHSALYGYIKGKAEGTWGISVTGNAATATKLQTARTIWGQSFNGSANVSGAITGASDITMSGALKLNGITISKTSNGLLKIDGDLIVTGGITMYATDGVASGLMEQILVDGTTIKKKADGTLYADINAIGGGTVKGATVGGTAVALGSDGILAFPAYPTLSSLGAAAASHTHTIANVTNLQSTLDGKSATSHTHSVKINGSTKTIAATGGTAVDLGTYLTAHQSVTNKAATLAWGTSSTIATIGSTNITVALPANPNTDTKNTAGSTDTSSKIFLIGATSQAANPQTYSHDTAYVGTDGCLYSGGTKVLTSHQTMYGLTIQANGTSLGTYTPNSAAKTFNITYANVGAAAASHTHAIADITNLQSALDGKAAASHTHSYLPLSGGTMTGHINLSSTNAKIAFGALTTSPITGYKAPYLASQGVGLYARYGGSSDEGAIIITEDTCVIYNSADTGWNFQVMDKDLGTDLTNDATRSFGVNQNHQAWSLAGFVKSGSSDSYVLLGGGGHKAVSDFATSGHTHSYLPLSGGTMSNTNVVANLNADMVDGYNASGLVKFYLSPMTNNAPADSAKSWFINTMPSASGAIVYNVPGSEKTIIAGKSSGAYGHMLQLNYDNTYLKILRYKGGSWQSTDWEKISSGYADSSGNADTLDGNHASAFATAGHNHFDRLSGVNIDTGLSHTLNRHYEISNAKGTLPFSSEWHQVYVMGGVDSGYTTQICTGLVGNTSLFFRHRINTTWYSWRIILDSENYNNYAPTKTGTGASGTWGISVTGNAATASKWATARTLTLTGSVTGSVSIDGSGNVTLATTTNHTHSYLPLSGGTMTGVLTANANMYEDAYKGALNMANSNIYGLNSIYTADLSDGQGEGIHFYRTSTTVDTFRISNGVMYFAPNRTLGSTATEYTLLHSGNYSSYALPKSGGTISGNLTVTGHIANTCISPNPSDAWGDGTNKHPWYGYDHRYPNTGVYSTTISDYFGITIRTASVMLQFPSSGNLQLNTGMTISGNITTGGGITMYSTSDRRLKKNIRGFNACDELMKLGGVYQFEYIDEEIERNKIYKGSHIGLLYQNVKGTILDKMCLEREDGYGALNYLDTSFISLLAGVGIEHEMRLRGLEAGITKYESKTDKKIRLMKKKINDLEVANKALDAANKALEARIKELEGSREERRTA